MFYTHITLSPCTMHTTLSAPLSLHHSNLSTSLPTGSGPRAAKPCTFTILAPSPLYTWHELCMYACVGHTGCMHMWRNVTYRHTYLTHMQPRVHMTQANMTQANMTQTHMTKAHVTQAHMTKAQATELHPSDTRSCPIPGTHRSCLTTGTHRSCLNHR